MAIAVLDEALVRTLPSTPDEQETSPGPEPDSPSSLIVVCLTVLLPDATLHGGREHDILAKSAWQDTAEWAAFGEPALAKEYLHISKEPYARVPTDSEIDEIIELATAAVDDPHAEDRNALEQEGLSATLLNGVWVIDDAFHNPRRMAARVTNLVSC